MKINISVMLIIISQIYCYTTNAIEEITYEETFLKHNDNASDKWENYFDIYQSYLQPYVGKSASILEIGVLNGGHLQILEKYLSSSQIYGIDIISGVCKLNLGSNIKTFCFNATKKELIDQNLKELTFDVIIDDASHNSQDVIQTFELMFSRVEPGGIYIIEDLHASYWKEFNGGHKVLHSQIEYLKSLIDIINAYHVKKDDTYHSNDQEYYNNLSVEKKELMKWINSITFYDSVAVIKKFKTPRSKPYLRKVVGSKQPVNPTIDNAKVQGYYYNPSK